MDTTYKSIYERADCRMVERLHDTIDFPLAEHTMIPTEPPDR
jgi:hypothetical protein